MLAYTAIGNETDILAWVLACRAHYGNVLKGRFPRFCARHILFFGVNSRLSGKFGGISRFFTNFHT